jgi:hypothetical protein
VENWDETLEEGTFVGVQLNDEKAAADDAGHHH